MLDSVTSPSNTDIENELAIHDYLVENVSYVDTGDSSYNAYSALINGIAVCSGYTECFKTFMDMLGIENGTVSGEAGNEQHIWNTVMLDGQWYHVDVTWDDPIGSSFEYTDHAYFNISEKYGTYQGEVKGITMYTFPDVNALKAATVDDLKELKTGFRAPYIYDAVSRVYDKSISYDELAAMESQAGIQKMCEIKGVGNKVASCVSLFALGKRDSFPIDVWIKRIMEYLYFDKVDTSKEVIAEFARNQFGELGGYAQQYLFYYGKGF